MNTNIGNHSLVLGLKMPSILRSYPFPFFEDLYTVYLADDRRFFIPIRHICKTLGLDVKSQRRRIAEDRAISDAVVTLKIETEYRDSARQQDVQCLDIRYLPYWLGTINSRRVKEEHRNKIVQYQQELSEATWAVFRSDIFPTDILAKMDVQDSPEKKRYHEIMDEMNLIREKLLAFEETLSVSKKRE